VCAVCGPDLCGFGEVILCCVWECNCGFGGVSVCSVCYIFLWDCGSVCVLCVGQCDVGFWASVFALFGIVWCELEGVSFWENLVWFWGSDFVLFVG